MQILVTGGAGFIGSSITEQLLKKGYDVVVLDNLDPYYDLQIKRYNLRTCREVNRNRFEFIEGSITNASLVEEVIAGRDVDVIFHEAAKAGVRPSVEQPKEYNRNNINGLLTVLEAAAEHGVGRFVNASSSSVYGVPEYLPYDENHPNHPKSPYAVTKRCSEHYCNIYNNLHDLPTVNLRYFTVYGPRMRPNMAISNFVSRSLNDEPLIIYGDGKQTRDFTFIRDVVEVNLDLLETDAADGEIINVGSGDNISIRELAEYVVKETDSNAEIIHEGGKDADARHTHADISKADRLIDYEPSVDILHGVSMFIDWYRQNQDWYEPLVRG